jgi:predicted amidophosphoribosyltransferase
MTEMQYNRKRSILIFLAGNLQAMITRIGRLQKSTPAQQKNWKQHRHEMTKQQLKNRRNSKTYLLDRAFDTVADH